jgi:hypothetical protein
MPHFSKTTAFRFKSAVTRFVTRILAHPAESSQDKII